MKHECKCKSLDGQKISHTGNCPDQEPTRECCDSPCHHCPYFINECKPCHSIKPPVEELLTEEKAREILGEKSNIDFKNHMSHYHCWQQNQPPACGQPLEDHKQCCLCSKIYKPRKKHG